MQKTSIGLLIVFFIVAFNFSGCGLESPWDTKNQLTEATVIKVKDGDSVILRYVSGLEKEARLFGIDAPEYDQPYGRDAKRTLEKLLLKKSVHIENRGEDRYKRDIVLLTLENNPQSVNFEMIRLGAAWVYVKYQDDRTWQRAEDQAKKARRGLWTVDQAIAPWEWRER